MLRTDRHSVYFDQFHQFGLVRSTSVHFGQFWSNLVYFGPLQFNWVHLVYFDKLSPIQSIRSISIQFGQSILLWSNLAYLVNSIHVDLFCPIGFTLVHSIYLVNFRSFRSNLVCLQKNGKIRVLVKSTINYLSYINCNYIISFGCHNNLIKRMRI